MIERLASARTALLVIDIQDRLISAMPEAVANQLVRNAGVLIDAASRFAIPIVVSQQYPKGLGATVPPLEAALAAASGASPGEAASRGVPDATGGGTKVHRFDKLEFSACASHLAELRRGPLANRDQWIVIGMEAHVCVYQTVRDLVAAKQQVHVVADGVASRTKHNFRIGLDLMRTLGAYVTSTEVCVFDLLERAGTEHFKALAKAIK